MIMEISQADQDAFTVVKVLPITRQHATVQMPVLFCRDTVGECVFSRESLAWAYAQLSAYSSGKILSNIRAVSKFTDFYMATSADVGMSIDDLEYLVYAFVSTRLTGTLDSDGKSRIEGLAWKPAQFSTVQQEFISIVKYMDFCSTHFGQVIIADAFRSSPKKSFFQRLYEVRQQKNRDMLVHLNAARDYWKEMAGVGRYQLPSVAYEPPGRSVEVRNFPTVDEVKLIIKNTDNVVYKAIFIAAAFGGLRISEILNTWSVDVLPGEYRAHFFSEPQREFNDTVLYLRADPIHSTYCGEISDDSRTRAQYLEAEFGVRPRPTLHKTDPLYAGWKGTMYTGARLTHQVFFIDPEAARLFEDCVHEVQDFLRIIKTGERHPYLFVITSDPSRRHIGEPVKIRNVEQAFERACRRVGITPHKFGRNIHGLRHYY